MPKLSDTMTEGTLVKWRKKPGEKVEIGDVVAEVETDKAVMEMEAFDEGIFHEVIVKEGGKAQIGPAARPQPQHDQQRCERYNRGDGVSSLCGPKERCHTALMFRNVFAASSIA